MENLMDNLKLEDSKEEKVKIYIEMKHFEIALKKTQPSLSEDEIMKYEYFYENFTNGKKSQEKRVTLM
jgi:SpoVK/Ycf46/Vps4 family AAA+-type ATPase